MKYRRCCIMFFLFLVLGVCLVPFPRRIDREFDGVRWENGDSEIAEECTIEIQGWYYCYLFRDDVFKGSIRISGVEDTTADNNFVLDISFGKSAQHSGRVGSVMIYDADKNIIQPLGEIVISGAFGKICFRMSPDELISAPATTRGEAVELATELIGEEFGYH